MDRELLPHAVVLLLIGILVAAWDPVGLAMPPLDALLAPTSAGPMEAVATLLGLGGRLLGILVLPGLTTVILVDAALVAFRPRGGERSPPDAG